MRCCSCWKQQSGEGVSLLYNTVDTAAASSLPEHETLLYVLEDGDIVTFHTESISEMEFSGLDDTLPLSQELIIEAPLPPSMDMVQGTKRSVKKIVVIHRRQILRELFVRKVLWRITSTSKLFPDGKLEKTVDGDVLSEF